MLENASIHSFIHTYINTFIHSSILILFQAKELLNLDDYGQFALFCDATHPLQLQAFLDSRFKWYSLSLLQSNKHESQYKGGLLLLDNLPETVYKNAQVLSSLSYHWLVLDTKHTPERLSEVAQRAGVLLHFFRYPFQTKFWSREFLDETVKAINLQQTS